MREYRFEVMPEEQGMKFGTLLLHRLNLARGRLSSLKFNGGLFLDGVPAHTGVSVSAGQTVTVVLPDGDAALTPWALPLRIAFEDEDLLIVDKGAPLPSLRSSSSDEKTLENAVYAYMGCPERFTYRPVNRLDKGTSGLMVIAKNAHVQYQLQRQLHSPSFIRRYLAVTEGVPEAEEGVIDLPIAAEENGVRRFIAPDGKPSVTRYRVLKKENGRSLLLLQLETGRTHQIRVHLAVLGCPVCGDYLYGKELEALPGRFALHSCFVSLEHPGTGRTVTAESALPEELAALLTGSGSLPESPL